MSASLPVKGGEDGMGSLHTDCVTLLMDHQWCWWEVNKRSRKSCFISKDGESQRGNVGYPEILGSCPQTCVGFLTIDFLNMFYLSLKTK